MLTHALTHPSHAHTCTQYIFTIPSDESEAMVCLYQKDPRSEGRRRTGDGEASGVNLTIGFHIMKVSRRGEGEEGVRRG